MPNELKYQTLSQQGGSDSSFAADCIVSYSPEGYTLAKMYFETFHISNIGEVIIKINNEIVYQGQDYSEKTYHIATGSKIESFISGTADNGIDSSNPAGMAVYILLLK